MLYALASLISFGIRVILYYLTIETTPIFENDAVGWIMGHILPIHSMLWLISYTTVGRIGYERGDWPVLGVILYAVIYIPLLLAIWSLLGLLTVLNILPI